MHIRKQSCLGQRAGEAAEPHTNAFFPRNHLTPFQGLSFSSQATRVPDTQMISAPKQQQRKLRELKEIPFTFSKQLANPGLATEVPSQFLVCTGGQAQKPVNT